MKRESQGGGMAHMKAGHMEKEYKGIETGDMKYAKYGMDNEKELKESTDKLAQYAKKNKMKY